KSETAVVERFCVAWRERNRFVVARQGRVKTLEFLKSKAAVAERFGVVRPQRNRLVITRQSLIKTLEFVKSGTTIAERFVEVRLGRNRLLVASHRRIKPLQRKQNVAAAVVDGGRFSVDLHRGIDKAQTLGMVALLA